MVGQPLMTPRAFLGHPFFTCICVCCRCDVQQGAEKLKWILENHDSHIEEYKQNTSKVLARYSIENPLLSKVYDILIKNLFLHGNNGKLVYDENTNIYKF